jgi:hypothetical protein
MAQTMHKRIPAAGADVGNVLKVEIGLEIRAAIAVFSPSAH